MTADFFAFGEILWDCLPSGRHAGGAPFNVAAANCDDHTKNVAFLMTPTGEWSLAPAYDVTHAYNPDNRWLRQHLRMTGNVRLDSLARIANHFSETRFAVSAPSATVRDCASPGAWHG